MRQIILLVIGLIGGAALSQAPEFLQQYRQNLNGEVRGLSRSISRFERAAPQSGSRSDALVLTVQDRDRLAEHERRLEESGPFLRLVEFARDYDPDAAEATFDRFEPAVPVTLEGAAHAAAGFVGLRALGVLLLGGLAALGLRRRTA